MEFLDAVDGHDADTEVVNALEVSSPVGLGVGLNKGSVEVPTDTAAIVLWDFTVKFASLAKVGDEG